MLYALLTKKSKRLFKQPLILLPLLNVQLILYLIRQKHTQTYDLKIPTLSGAILANKVIPVALFKSLSFTLGLYKYSFASVTFHNATSLCGCQQHEFSLHPGIMFKGHSDQIGHHQLFQAFKLHHDVEQQLFPSAG